MLTDPPADQPIEATVLAAYEGMWDTYFEAGRPPAADPDVEQLRDYAADEALDALVSGLTSLREQSLVFEGDVVLSPDVVELTPPSSPTEAQVEDCADSRNSARVKADGEPFDDEPGGLRRIVADLELRGDQWKVVNFAVLGVGSCDG